MSPAASHAATRSSPYPVDLWLYRCVFATECARSHTISDRAGAGALQEQEVVTEIVTSWMREGLQQGKHAEALALVLRQRRRRVGPLEAACEEQIHRLSLEAL